MWWVQSNTVNQQLLELTKFLWVVACLIVMKKAKWFWVRFGEYLMRTIMQFIIRKCGCFL